MQQNSEKDAGLEAIREAQQRKKTLTRVHKKLSKQVEVLTRESLPPHLRAANDPSSKGEDHGRPTFVEAARFIKRLNLSTYKREGIIEPILELYPKPAAREFAKSHGVRVPHIFGSWDTIGDIPWDSLPTRCVIKSSHGGGGISVFPLERRGEHYHDFITGKQITKTDVIDKLHAKQRPGAVYFAEEFLSRPDGDPNKLPDDVKVFCFYGEVGFLETRADDGSRNPESKPRARFYLPDGSEVKSQARPFMPQGRDLADLTDLEYILEAAATISSSIRRPFVRIDFFSTAEGPVFGEITQNPGHTPLLLTNWDIRIGKVFDRALGRILGELHEAGHLEVTFGDTAG